MQSKIQVPRRFYKEPAEHIARNVLGMRLVRILDGVRIAGIIVEAEAYQGEEDLGCHAKAGFTPRTKIMYIGCGHAYVYFTYGMHWMFNLVCDAPGTPAAVLVRAIIPQEGIERMQKLRPFEAAHLDRWTNGPAKLCQALAIDGSMNGHDLCKPDSCLFLETAYTFSDTNVQIGPRIGLNSVPEPWLSIPWRFYLSPTVQKELILNV